MLVFDSGAWKMLVDVFSLWTCLRIGLIVFSFLIVPLVGLRISIGCYSVLEMRELSEIID